MSEEIEALRQRILALAPTTVTRPTLVYFDIIGIAWPIRCLLHLQQVDYELIQISVQQWNYRDAAGEQVLKRSFTNGHVPLYVDQQIRISQSLPILQYLAERNGMLGQGDIEKYAVLELVNHAYDALFHFNGMLQIMVRRGVSDEVVAARLDAFMGKSQWGLVSNGYDNHLRGFQNYLESNSAQSGYMVGPDLTVADLHAFNVLCNWYKAFSRERFADYALLEDYIQRIANYPGVADYVQTAQEPTAWFQLPEVAIRLTSPEELQGLVKL